MKGSGLFLAAVFTATGSAAVPAVDIYPMVDRYYAMDFRSNPLCEAPLIEGAYGLDKYITVDMKAGAYPGRASLGLRALSKELLTLYKENLGGKSVTDLRYQAGSRRKTMEWETVKKTTLASTLVRFMEGNVASLRDTICEAFHNGVEDSSFCQIHANVTMRTSCMSDYEYQDPASVLKTVSDWDTLYPTDEDCFTKQTSGAGPLDMKLQLFSTIPDEIDAATAYSERRTYYAAWQAIERLERYAERKYLEIPQTLGKVRTLQELITDETITENILPEWPIQKVFYAHQMYKGDKSVRQDVRLPMAVLARRGSNLLVVIRRPITTYEAKSAVEDGFAHEAMYNFTGAIHDGSGTYRSQLSSILEYEMRKFLHEVRDSEDPEVITGTNAMTFVGADFPGSGAAAGLAQTAARLRDSILGTRSGFRVQSITFGSPYIGNEDFADYMVENVNIRHIEIEADGTNIFPCSNNRACDERHNIARSGAETGVRHLFKRMPGYFRIRLSELAKLNEQWAQPEAVMQLAAIRDCAYRCALGTRACKNDPSVIDACQNCESWVTL